MIAHIKGLIAFKQAPKLTIDTNGGVGYEVNVPMPTFLEAPAVGSEFDLVTHLIVKEDSHTLYGFESHMAKDVFLALLTVSGVGPKSALGLMSIPLPTLVQAISEKNLAKLCSIPGVGKKSAERLVLELPGKLEKYLVLLPAAGDEGVKADVASALSSLGYSAKEIASVQGKLSGSDSVERSLKEALQLLTH